MIGVYLATIGVYLATIGVPWSCPEDKQREKGFN
ncbi:hypothetical protein SLEP1_g12337 [Rubroshorea leprosula]|uniref:Photosystem II protein N n=1 Tax=Rubroshorea leprosula TaxID=152421 RepID=A0AAV5ILM1_9ROSI|nr:hypothetical protein SLEP1_g12337 [Rubroshorea leprosula]